MQLTKSLRKMLVLGVTGAVVVTGTAFADDHLLEEPAEGPAEEPAEVPADEPVVPEEIPTEEAPVEQPVVEESLEEVIEEPAAEEEEPTTDETAEIPSTDDVTELADDSGEVVEDAVHPANHGAVVSEAAHSDTPEGFRNHGEYVSGVARGEHGPQVESTEEADAT